MATRKLGDVSVGEVVKLKENGSPVDYLVVHKGIPNYMYDSSCDGVWLLRKNVITVVPWGSNNNKYETSDLHLDFFNIDLLAMYESKVKDLIKTVKIPYVKGGGTGTVATGAYGLETKAFALSVREVGDTDTSKYYPNDGYSLDYFKGSSLSDLISCDSNGVARGWWLRSPAMNTYDTSVIYVDERGYTLLRTVNVYVYARPALILPYEAQVYDDLVTVNNPPNIPSSITVPDTIHGGEDTSIIWSAATDPDGNLDGYIVERSYNGGSSWTQIYQGRSTSTTTTIPFGTETVMFRVCAYDTYGEKSGWTTSVNRVVINNHVPSAPPSISVPLTPAGGESLSVTWTASTDVDGNLEGYELERQWDGAGAFTQIYKGAALSFQDDIPKGEHSSVVYRVRAYDSFDAYSSYTTSPSRTIDNNTAPVIACDLSGALGEKSEGFSIPYTVSDAEQQAVTVTEKVGDLVKRTYKATLDEQATFEVTGEYFQRILNGAQAVQIVATDSAGKSSTFELPFTKAVHKAVIMLSEPLAVEEQITVAVLAVTGDIPADAAYQVEMTNNGNDPEPVWEDATADVKAGRNYVFQNKTQTNGWAFNFRVTAERGESDEDGYIVSIQGGFQ